MATRNTSDDSGSKPPVSRYTEVFDKKDTEVILKLFKKELDAIRYFATIKIEAAECGLGCTLSICYKENRADKARPAVADLRMKLRSVKEKILEIPTDKRKEFIDFARKCESNPDVVLLPDNALSFVEIKGKSSKSVEDAADKLRLILGILPKGTSRVNHHFSDMCYSSAVSEELEEMGPRISDIDKYKKERRSFDCYPDQSADDPGRKSYHRSSSKLEWAGSAHEGFNFTTELKNGFILKVYKASITRLDVEVIVNAANDTMMHEGGVAKVISEKAGHKLDKKSRDHVKRNGKVQVGENIVTTAGRLPYKAVIHAVGPRWHHYKDKVTCLDDLYICVYNILDTCKKKSFRTVAMSAISAGQYAVPKELCADMYVYAAANFSKNRLPSECPEELHIIDVDTKILQLVEESVKRWQQDQELLNQRKTVPEYLKKNPYLCSHNTEGDRPSSSCQRGHRHGGTGIMGSYGDVLHGIVPQPTMPERSQLELNCGIQRLPDEKFRWGGKAKVFILDKQLKVKIFQGDISKVRGMDAIVCGTSKDLKARGLVANALKKVGGPRYISCYDSMVQKHKFNNIKSSDVFKCEGGTLGSKYVLHAVVNRLEEANRKEIQEYQECFESILKNVKRNDFRKLAIPLLGTGTFQTNKWKLKLFGKALLKTLDNYLVKYRHDNEIDEIHLINNSDFVTDALEEVFIEAADLKENSCKTKSFESFDGDKMKSFHFYRERNGAGARKDERRGLYSNDSNVGRDGRNIMEEGYSLVEDKDTDSDSDHKYVDIDMFEPMQARLQGILNPDRERRDRKNVNYARAKGKEADMDGEVYGRAKEKDTDSERDHHYDINESLKFDQARYQDILNPDKERRDRKNVNYARAKGKEADSDGEVYGRVKEKDTDSERDHHDDINESLKFDQARHQDILDPDKERESEKSVIYERVEDIEAGSERYHDTIPPDEPKQAQQQTTPKPAESPGNLLIIES